MLSSGIVPTETYDRLIQKCRALGVPDLPYDVLPQSYALLNKMLVEAGFPIESPNLSTIALDIYEKLNALVSGPVAGSISGSVATFTTDQAINLTSLAGIDWAAFGYNAGPTSIERKSTGGSKISALTQVGAIALGSFNYGSTPPAWHSTWTDGAPDASISNEAYGVYCAVSAGQGPGPGLSFTVPADTTSRTVVVYAEIDLNSGQALLTATLSDGSAGPYTDNSVNGTIRTAMAYTITYKAASAGQHLTIALTNNTSSAQNVTIFAATLS